MSAAQYSINSHLKYLKKAIAQSEKYQKMFDRKSFLSDELTQDAICRALQVMLEAALTIGEMIIAKNGFRKPEKNDEVFEILADEGVYGKDFAEKLWGAGGFRNILVHNYIELNLKIVYDNLEKGVPVFKEYAKLIGKYCVKN